MGPSSWTDLLASKPPVPLVNHHRTKQKKPLKYSSTKPQVRHGNFRNLIRIMNECFFFAGNITCPACQLVSTWAKMEPFFSTSQTRAPSKDVLKARDDFVKKKPLSTETIKISENAVPVDRLSKEELQATLSQLKIEVKNVTKAS